MHVQSGRSFYHHVRRLELIYQISFISLSTFWHMKRTRDQLTGGSKDVNPQTMVVQVTQSGVDVPTGQGIALPIPRLPIAKGRSLVIELLGVTFITAQFPTIAASNIIAPILTTNGTTPTTLVQAYTDPKVLAIWSRAINFSSAASVFETEQTKYIDLTDNAGHGILVATDQIYLVGLSLTTGVANVFIARLEYRFKDVALEEYIGIVQSQQ